MTKLQQTWLDPKNDFVFKWLFGSIRNKDLSISFLNAILEETEPVPITDLSFDDPHLKKTSVDDKESILDVLAKTADGKRINLEIQLSNQHNMIERAIHYCCKLHSEQMVAGQKYETVTKTIIICIVNFSFLPHNRYHSFYHFHEGHIYHKLTELVELHFVELPKLTSTLNISNKKECWFTFLQKVDPTKWEELAKSMPEIQKAMHEIDYMSHDEKLRMQAFRREKAILNQRSNEYYMEKGLEKGLKEGLKKGIEKGIEKGIKKGKMQQQKEIAKKMLLENVDIAFIAKITALSEQDIYLLQQELFETAAATKEQQS
jgi:predicted transposase/invertase (TIGR01784 family)